MTEPTIPPATLSKEERATLIKILFVALQVPPWTKDDLVGFGKIIFTKTDIKDLAEKDANLFNRLLPHLAKIADFLWDKILATQNSTSATSKSLVNTPPTNVSPIPSPISPSTLPTITSPESDIHG